MATATTTLPAAGTWTFDKAHTQIGFAARHLMVTKVRGRVAEFDGTVTVADRPEKSHAEVVMQAASITTGTIDRDNHLRSPDFFDVANFPTLRFKSTKIERNGDRWKLTGDLTIKNLTKPVTLDVSYEGIANDPWGKEHVAFSATVEVNTEDWGLTWNVALETGGWLVSKKATIEIEGQLVKTG